MWWFPFKLRKLVQNITKDLNRQHLIYLKQKLTEKQPEYASGHDARGNMIYILWRLSKAICKLEILHHLPYSLKLVPSNYHLFRSMHNALKSHIFRVFCRYFHSRSIL